MLEGTSADFNEMFLQQPRTMMEEDEEDDHDRDEAAEEFLVNNFPDWQLIDEISIRLLEQGVGTFETLQRALPSVVLAQIEQILPDHSADPNEAAHQELEKENRKHCSVARMLKLFRLAQLQIDYLLKTQQGLVERMATLEQKAKQWKRENRALREQFYRGPSQSQAKGDGGTKNGTEEIIEGAQWGRELFRCNECTKLFLHANFLAEHIQRKHNGQIESAARLASVKTNKAGRVLGMDEPAAADFSSSREEQLQERVKSVAKRKGAPQRGQSHGRSGTFRKRNDHRSSTGTVVMLPRQHSQTQHHQEQQRQSDQQQMLMRQQTHQQDQQNTSGPPSTSSIGEEIAIIGSARENRIRTERRKPAKANTLSGDDSSPAIWS